MFCSKCGKEVGQSENFCSSCGTMLSKRDSDKDKQEADWDRRILCRDGRCIGIIGEDGRCNICRKPYQCDEKDEGERTGEISCFRQSNSDVQAMEEKKSKWKLYIFFAVAIVLLGLFAGRNNNQTASSSSNTKTAPVKSPQELRREQIEKNFSAWDGSLPALEEIIKKSMNDPDSHKHEETRYSDRGNYLIVTTTFRGKNAFGGVVKNSVTAKVDLNGNVLEIISQGR